MPKGVNKHGGNLATPVSLTSGTVYWLALGALGEQFDFQGTTQALAYREDTGSAGVLPSTWPTSDADGGILPIMWGEDTIVPWIVAESTRSDTADATTHAVNYPAPSGGILADDLLICFVGIDGLTGQTVSWPDGTWNEILDTVSNNAVTCACAWKRASGGESGSFTVTSSASEGGGFRVLCVRNAHPSTAPEIASTTGNSTNPNPPSLNPTNWDTPENTLWIAAAGNDLGTVAITAAPTGYHGLTNTRWNNASGAGVATAWTQTSAASEDPGTFTMATEQWVAWTVGVRPATSAVYEDLSVALSGESSFTNAIVPVRGLSFAASAESSLTSVVTATKALSVALSGESSLTADLTEIGVTYEELAAVLSGESSLTANATKIANLAVALSGQSTFTATAIAVRNLAAAYSAQSALTADMLRRIGLAADLSASSTFTANIEGSPAVSYEDLAVTLSGQSSLSVAVTRVPGLSVAMSGESALDVSIARTLGLTVALSGASSLDANMVALYGMAVAWAAQSGLLANLIKLGEGDIPFDIVLAAWVSTFVSLEGRPSVPVELEARVMELTI
jgi:hypothetical protein